MIVEKFIPGAITGFFDICHSPNIENAGTTGFSVCISKGLFVKMEAIPSEGNSFTCHTDGKRSVNPVSEYVHAAMAPGIKDTYDITFTYTPEVEIGAGFGMSGATALGTAFCLAKLQDIKIDPKEVAYMADAATQGGYGDVISQLNGGAMLRTTPGIGSRLIGLDTEGLKIVCAIFGPLSTKDILKDEKMVKNIKREGSMCLTEAMAGPGICNIMSLCRRFSKRIGLETPRLAEAIDAVSSANSMPASMSMLGESLFLFAREEALPKIADVLGSFDANIMVCDVWRKKNASTH
ncbi:MAG: hypothetical protein JW825_00940 [Candidatus Methanofastidiosa archaeon]|nr:hypothetical protein [Candidatus Methanofastidiosa archaeon]